MAEKTPIPPPPSLSITSPVPIPNILYVLVVSFFGTVDIVVIGLRIYFRVTRAGRFFLNDFLFGLGILSTLAATVAATTVISLGVAGHHIDEVVHLVPERYALMAKMIATAYFGWTFGVTFFKLSLLSLYQQIFGLEKSFIWRVRIIETAVVIGGVVIISLIATTCPEFSDNWSPELAGRCVSPKPRLVAAGVYSLVFDIAILVIPMPKLWNLNMSFKRKAGLSSIFGIGFIICGVQIWRLDVTESIDFEDLTYKLSPFALSAVLELQLSIVVASIPIISAAFSKPVKGYKSRLSTWNRARMSSKNFTNIRQDSSSREGLTANNKHTSDYIDRKTFRKLYDHVYPLSEVTAKGRVDTYITAEPIESRREGREGENLRDIEIVTDLTIQYQ